MSAPRILMLATLVFLAPACGTGSGGGTTSPWPSNPQNLPLCTALDDQTSPHLVADGTGGAIIVWEDLRSGTALDIYAQRFDGAGVVQWTADGVVICAAANHQSAPQAVSDGAGGAIIVWSDLRGGVTLDIYAQRVNAAGAVQWTAGGVVVSAAADSQEGFHAIEDGNGGVIVAWLDVRTGNKNIYAQRLDGAGAALWTTDGVAVCTDPADEQSPQVLPDATGGAIVAWEDSRNGNVDVYAQRLNSAGVVQWTADGVPVSAATGSQWAPKIVTDGSGGAILVWTDFRGGADSHIYGQRIDGSGVSQWTPDGIAVCATLPGQSGPRILSDGSGGAIVVWEDGRDPTGTDIYAQRLKGDGTLRWKTDGVVICGEAELQSLPLIVSDGSDGAIIAWQDNRSMTNTDFYAQRIDGSGKVKWPANGGVLCLAANDWDSSRLVSDGSGGAILVWTDLRSGTSRDIYSQRVGPKGPK